MASVVLAVDREVAIKQFIDLCNSIGSSCSAPGRKISHTTAVKFLYARKFDVPRAVSLYETHQATRRRECLYDINPDTEPLRSELQTGKFTILPARDSSGAAIALFTASKHSPMTVSHATTLQGIVYQLDSALQDTETQKAGLIFIYDMSGSKYSNFDYDLSQKILMLLKGGYPARLKKVLIVTAPLWFKAPFKILRLFVREKLRERVFTVSVPTLSLHVPRKALPVHLGGTLRIDHNIWLLHCRKSMTNRESELLSNIEQTAVNSGENCGIGGIIENNCYVGKHIVSVNDCITLDDILTNGGDCANIAIVPNQNITINGVLNIPTTATAIATTTTTKTTTSTDIDSSPTNNILAPTTPKKHKLATGEAVDVTPTQQNTSLALSSSLGNGINCCSTRSASSSAGSGGGGGVSGSGGGGGGEFWLENPPSSASSGFSDDDSLAGQEGDPKTIEQIVQKVKELGREGLVKEYSEIRCRAPEGTFVHARMQNNLSKNRYTDVLCYDHTRVVLSREKFDDTSDYINANFVDGYKQKNAYISTQGPLPKTFHDFWRMVWEQNCLVIVMTTRVTERGRTKCGQYWETSENSSLEFGNFRVRTISIETNEDYTISSIELKNLKTDEVRNVSHWQFTCWPDYGVPSSAMAMLNFLQKVRDKQAEMVKGLGDTWAGHSRGPPIVVHCSAGIGRTGTFITLDICISRLEDVGTADIRGTVEKIRSQRAYSIQMPDQYVFCHLALIEYAVEHCMIKAVDFTGFNERNDDSD